MENPNPMRANQKRVDLPKNVYFRTFPKRLYSNALRRPSRISYCVDLLLRCAQPRDTTFLVPPKPRLAGLAKGLSSEVVDELADDNQRESNWVHPVNAEVENLDSNNHTPEIRSQKTDVEEGSGGESEDDRG